MIMEVKAMTEKPKLTHKPILKNGKQQSKDSQKAMATDSKISKRTINSKRQPQNDEVDPEDIPLMFQAQIKNRGNIQYVGEKKDKKTGEKSKEEPKYEQWVQQWLDGCPPVSPKSSTVVQISSKRTTERRTVKSSGLNKWQADLAQFLSPDTQQDVGNQPSPLSIEPLGDPWEYQVRWRLVTNSGQDSVIRPVIGRKGMPFFPGSSMKGAFRNACLTLEKEGRMCKEDRMRYCGGEKETKKGEKRTQPGILRFHGGYPVDDEWRRQRDRLVDIVHNQEEYQVRDDKAEHNANVQISLYQTRFKFNISSTEPLSPQEWDEVKKMWERALGYGLGSRISAGYGYMDNIPTTQPVLRSVHLKGQGLSSLLLLPVRSKTDEFRPNMFKAALRGHTWRLLAGITDEATAQKLTHQLWGGIGKSAVEGSIRINFSLGELIPEEHLIKKDKKTGKVLYNPRTMPMFTLKNGCLDLLKIKELKPEIETFLVSLVQFTMLLGGFGKSWRRINHNLFYKSYFKNEDNPMIGSHWEFTDRSKNLYIPVMQEDLSEVSIFLKELRRQTIDWLQVEEQPLNNYVRDWRETWHPDKVQVWGRIASNSQSQAVRWFHDEKYLKGTTLAGSMGKIGRIWHRMYPRHILENGKISRLDKEYVELLTIFPDSDSKSQRFLNFLATDKSQFHLLNLTED